MHKIFKRFSIPPLISTILMSVACPAPIFAQPADMLNLASAQIVQSPAQVATWPATVDITRVDIASDGILISTAAPIPWPDFIPPGFDGPLQYTVWACVQPAAWRCTGLVQMWRDRASIRQALPPLPSGAAFWWGSQAGGAIHDPFGGYVPQPGDVVALFLAAGDERGDSANFSTAHERSNVVTFSLVAGDVQTVSFSGVTPPQPPVTPPPPPVVVVPPVDPSAELMDRIASLEDDVVSLKTTLDAATQDIAILGQRMADLATRAAALESRPMPVSCSASVFGVPIHCSLTK